MASVTSDSGLASLNLGLGIISPDMNTSPDAGSVSRVNIGATSRDALKHVLDNVLCLPATSGLRQSLQAAGYIKIEQMLSMTPAAMESLSYKAKVAGVVSNIGLLLSEQETLSVLKGFARFKHAHLGRPLTPPYWLLVTEDEFDEYQGYFHMNPGSQPVTTPPIGNIMSTPGNVSHVAAAPPVSEFVSFRRGIKRDQSLFPVLKEERDWDDWQRRLRTQATAQGVENVLDPFYTPSPPDYALFREQNKYMMAVFTNCVQTDYGKGLIRKYENSHDAQKLFGELEQRALSSTSAIITASELLSYVTTATLGRNTWNGTTTSFVLHWEEQVRLYERYVDSHSHFSPEMKRTLLQNAVNGIGDLRQVKLNADQLLQANGYRASYDDYRDLLLNACARYDADWHVRGQQRTPTSAPSNTSTRRTVYSTDVGYNDHLVDFGFDTPVSVISAFRTRMSGSQWHNLDSASQRIWDSLSDSAKETILGGGSNNDRSRQSARRPGTRGVRPSRPPDTWQSSTHDDTSRQVQTQDEPTRQVHTHDVYPDHNMGRDSAGVESPDNNVVEPVTADTSDHYLAMATRRSKPTSPAVLQNMMSPSRARGESNNSNRQANSTRIVNTCTITYSVSQHPQKTVESLVDRGANGGLAGTDMRVIATSPYRFVHVKGIDNHHVRDVPLVTAVVFFPRLMAMS